MRIILYVPNMQAFFGIFNMKEDNLILIDLDV